MESHFTLPAESYSVPNGISPKTNQSTRQLSGNNLWAVGHLADSTNHNLFYFDGIKGGKCVWHKFQAPITVAEEVQLELAWDGRLALRMDKMLFVGTVESVSESRISWSSVSRMCRDFQIGQDYVCHRRIDSDNFSISLCDSPEGQKDLPPPPSPCSCYCLTSRDDVILLSGCDLLILKIPHNHWLRITTSVERTFPYFSAPKLPQFSKLLVTNGSLCGISVETESLYVLPFQSATWASSRLAVQVRDISAISGTSLSFLIIDSHFVLHTAVSDSANLRLTELSHSILPDKDLLFTSVGSIRSLFSKMDDVSLICSSSVVVPFAEEFVTAIPLEDQAMELEPTEPSTPSDFHSQQISFPSLSSPQEEETFLSPTREPVDQSEVSILSSAPIHTTSQSPPFDWMNVNLEEVNEPTIVRKRAFSPIEDFSHKYSKFDVTLPTYDRIDRTCEQRRIDRRFLRENLTPCPLPECSFIPSWRDFSYFESIAAARPESPARPVSSGLLEQTQIILAEQPFEFSEVRKEVADLSRNYPDISERCNSFPPPSAPPTQDFLL